MKILLSSVRLLPVVAVCLESKVYSYSFYRVINCRELALGLRVA